jgi:hypothetical protein
LAFEPRLTPEKFTAAFTASEGWGRFSQHLAGDTFNVEVEVKWGQLALATLGLTPPVGLRPRQVSATLAGQPIAAKLVSTQAGRVEISFAPDLVIPVGQTLKVTLT